MLWWVVILASIGILLGLWLRAASLLAASIFVAIAGAALVALLTEWSLLTMVVYVFALLCALQCGYLIGAVVAFSQRRANLSVYSRLRAGRDEVPRTRQDCDARP
jgi:hypothetical protein